MGLRFKKLLFVLSISFFVQSCSTQQSSSSEDLILEKALSQFNSIKSSNLKFKLTSDKKNPYGNNGNNEHLYSYVSTQNNSYDKLTSFEILDKNGKLELNNFKKFYSDSLNLHFIKKRNDIDTLYYFKINKFTGLRNFILGKYCFYAENFKMSQEELSLYYKNRDSLMKVRGNIKLFKNLK